MNKRFLVLLCAAPLLFGQQCPSPLSPTQVEETPLPPVTYVENPKVRIDTSKGTIVIELFAVQAPKTTQSFIQFVKDKYFDDTIIHAASTSEGIRGGRYNADLTAKSTGESIPNESSNGLSNRRRYVAMVDSASTGSATAEFVIYTADSTTYDYVSGTSGKSGRTVFGRVVDGMGVVDTIAGVTTHSVTAKNGTALATAPVDSVTVTITQTSGEPPPASQQPTITCPPAVDVDGTGDRSDVTIGKATATDAAGRPLTPTNDAPTNGFPIGATTVTWKATDAEGRVAICTQLVTVRGPLITTASGLQYQDLAVGTGDQPKDESVTVTVNYVGTLQDGTEFDSGDAVSFQLSRVIPGFSEGVLSMRVGGKRKLIIPPDLAYGAEGSPPKIPGNATLTFVVDLVEIKG